MRGAVAPGCLQLQHHLARGVALHPFVGQRRAGDVAAQLLQRIAVVGITAHSGVQAESVDVSAHVLLEPCLPRHDALHRQHLLAGARAKGDTVSTGCCLQRSERAGFVRIAAVVGQVRLALLFDQHTPTGEQLHRSGDDLEQHRLQCLIGRRGHLDERRLAIGAAPVHPVQHQAVQVDVEIGRRAKALDQRDRATLGRVYLEASLAEQEAREHAVHHLQNGRHQLGLCSQQQAQRDGQRQHPLPHRHVGMTWSTKWAAVCAMRRAPHEGQNHPPLAAKRDELVVAAVPAAQPQEAVGQDAALEEGVELVLHELRQVGSGSGFCLGEEGGGVLLHQAVQRGGRRQLSCPPCWGGGFFDGQSGLGCLFFDLLFNSVHQAFFDHVECAVPRARSAGARQRRVCGRRDQVARLGHEQRAQRRPDCPGALRHRAAAALLDQQSSRLRDHRPQPGRARPVDGADLGHTGPM